jgi:hypothetical protein
MYIFPAIDLYEGKAVRLYKGDYAQMTVYSENPVEVARDFEAQGAKFLHLVDLEGAKSGTTPNLETIKAIVASTDLFTEGVPQVFKGKSHHFDVLPSIPYPRPCSSLRSTTAPSSFAPYSPSLSTRTSKG